MSDARIHVIHEPTAAEPFLVLDKPSGLPSAPLRDGDDSALTQAVALFPDLAAVQGKKAIEKGLVHRIDTATRGCVLIAATQDAYAFLLAAQKNRQFHKWYRAQIDRIPDAASRLGGFPVPPLAVQSLSRDGAIIVQSRFRGYGENNRQVRPVSEQSGRAAHKKSGDTIYQTEITLQDDVALCKIYAGYRHQVRCHLAWIGLPVQNDPLYNPRCTGANTTGALAFTAYKIAFPHPLQGKTWSFCLEDELKK
mgnify:CR=1 FL=1